MKQKKKIYERRPNQGDHFVILVDSPYWPAGTVLQFVIKEWWYGHDCIAEFDEERKRDGCTILHMERVEDRPHGQKYLTDAEVQDRLKRRGLWTPQRAARQLEEGAAL